MRKLFSPRRNALLSSASVSWGGAALVVVALLLFIRLAAPDLFWTIFAPAFGASDAAALSAHRFVSGFGESASLSLENERLSEENAAYALENRALKEKLESISELAPGAPEIIAGVVARPPTSPYDTLILSAGSGSGVAEGMMALGNSGVPLGSVSSVWRNFSQVTLYSAPGVETQGWVGAARLPVIVRGEGGGSMSASAPRLAEIKEGDLVSIPGPGALPLGVVARVESDPLSSSATLRISPTFNLFSLTWVALKESGLP